MHREILTDNQLDLLPLIRQFQREYYLVGGTAIALHIGHRRSVDFDLFKLADIKPKACLRKIEEAGWSFQVTRQVQEQLNVVVNEVKMTFFQYPFVVPCAHRFDSVIKVPGIQELAAMKAYALGRRSKWKDYVDLYFILRDHLTICQITQKATEIFGPLFSEKLFRAQLSFFHDIDHSEPVEFLAEPVPDTSIREFLILKAMEF